MAKIIMTIKRGNGTPTAEVRVEGVDGPSCRALSQPYVDVIGGRVLSDKDTDDAAKMPTAGISSHVNA